MASKQQARYAKAVIQTARFFVERYDNRMLGERFKRMPLVVRIAVGSLLWLIGAASMKFILLLLMELRR